MIKARGRLRVLLCLVFIQYHNIVCSTSLGDVCSTDADCSGLVNTKCNKMYDCQTGVCACKSGYGNANGDGCEKILRSHGESCGAGFYCNGFEEECSGGVCQCTYWYDYNSLAGHCTLRTYKLLTQYCDYWQECLDVEAIECSGSRCQCQDGHIADTSQSYVSCRAPQYNERCLYTPSCTVAFDTSTISDDASSVAPTCSGNICTCPPSHEHKVVNRYNMCLGKVDSSFVRYGLGENCTHFNECNSLFCVKCPGAATGICMQGSSAVINKPSSDLIVIVLLLTHYMFML